MIERKRKMSWLRDPIDDSGATAIEYALLGASIAVALVAAVSTLGFEVQGLYRLVCTAVSSAFGGIAC